MTDVDDDQEVAVSERPFALVERDVPGVGSDTEPGREPRIVIRKEWLPKDQSRSLEVCVILGLICVSILRLFVA